MREGECQGGWKLFIKMTAAHSRRRKKIVNLTEARKTVHPLI